MKRVPPVAVQCQDLRSAARPLRLFKSLDLLTTQLDAAQYGAVCPGRRTSWYLEWQCLALQQSSLIFRLVRT